MLLTVMHRQQINMNKSFIHTFAPPSLRPLRPSIITIVLCLISSHIRTIMLPATDKIIIMRTDPSNTIELNSPRSLSDSLTHRSCSPHIPKDLPQTLWHRTQTGRPQKFCVHVLIGLSTRETHSVIQNVGISVDLFYYITPKF